MSSQIFKTSNVTTSPTTAQILIENKIDYTPKVSVIIPVYNVEKYLRQCLDSVVAQTLKEIEIICVDDGSTDSSLEILKEYAFKDPRFTIITQKNSGVISTKNFAIHSAKSEFIYPLDGDDVIDKTTLQKSFNAITNNKGDIITCKVMYIGLKNYQMILPKPTKYNMLKGNCLVNSALFRKSDFIKSGGYDIDYSLGLEDYDLWLNFIFKLNKKIYRIPEILFFYRIKHFTESRNMKNIKLHPIFVRQIHHKYFKQMLKYKIITNLKTFIKKIFSIKNSKNKDHKIIYILGFKFKIKRYIKELKKKKNSFFSHNRYINLFLNTDNTKTFVAENQSNYKKNKNDPLLLAYYLTQYHNAEINNKNFGKGFTEWTNVAKAKPLYEGHYQPHIPIDVSFYDLAHDNVMYRQIELAKKYGIGGFCFYYYWFSGERVLEKPLFNWLNNKELDFPFCLFWANETWQRRWFGGNKEILIEHKFDISMVENFFYDILPFFKDKRYIKIDNKPFFILYHYNEFKPQELKSIILKFDTLAKENGFNGIYFVGQGYKIPDTTVEEYGLHAVSEFSPCGMILPKHYMENKYIYPEYKGNMYDIKSILDNKSWIYNTNYTLYKGVFTAWDNTPRSFTNSNIYIGSSPETYKKWLKDTISWTKEHNSKDNQIIFINAWNEWGEGAHLEPDIKYGYAYLQATKEALEETR